MEGFDERLGSGAGHPAVALVVPVGVGHDGQAEARDGSLVGLVELDDLAALAAFAQPGGQCLAVGRVPAWRGRAGGVSGGRGEGLVDELELVQL